MSPTCFDITITPGHSVACILRNIKIGGKHLSQWGFAMHRIFFFKSLYRIPLQKIGFLTES